MQISLEWAWLGDVEPGAGHAVGAVARAMGQEEPDLYRDTWVRYLGEHREPGTGTGKRVPAPGTDIER